MRRLNTLFVRLLLGQWLLLAPLLTGMVIYAHRARDLAAEGRAAMAEAQELAQASRQLQARLLDLERAARQHAVLHEADLRAAVVEDRLLLLQAIDALLAASRPPSVERPLQALARLLTGWESFASGHGETIAASELDRAQAQARAFVMAADDWLNDAARALGERGDTAASGLLQVATLAVPLSLLAVALWTLAVTRPLQQMAEAIRRLGDGVWTQPIQVDGPHDLASLGERLDWLRGRLADAESHKAHLLRHVSHELKTPLTALREGAELLGEGVLGPLTSDQAEVVQILRTQSLRLQQRIEGLLDLNRALAGADRLQRLAVALSAAVAEVIDARRLEWQSRRLKLEIDVPDVAVHADRNALLTVLDNLIGNAIKYSPAGGRLRVWGRVLPDAVELTVQDDGPGLPPNLREHLFEPFVQGPPPPQGTVPGSGLGLTLAREWARLHGGEVSIGDSSGGACLVLRWPLAGQPACV